MKKIKVNLPSAVEKPLMIHFGNVDVSNGLINYNKAKILSQNWTIFEFEGDCWEVIKVIGVTDLDYNFINNVIIEQVDI